MSRNRISELLLLGLLWSGLRLGVLLIVVDELGLEIFRLIQLAFLTASFRLIEAVRIWLEYRLIWLVRVIRCRFGEVLPVQKVGFDLWSLISESLSAEYLGASIRKRLHI